jgi:predicted nucleic acid-binding protein
MSPTLIADTGPLVAYFDRDSEHHKWVRDQAANLESGWVTCEAVLTETSHLLRRAAVPPESILELIERGVLAAPFRVESEVAALRPLLVRYRNVPMSLADACLVRLSELYQNCIVFTLDSDFTVYRRFGRRTIPVLLPPT